MLRKKGFIYLLVIIILSLNFVSAYASNIDELKEEKKEIEEQIKEGKNQIKQIEAQTKEVSKQIDELDKQMTQTSVELASIEKQLKDIENKIEITTQELEEAEANLVDKKDLFNKRIRVMYMNGNIGYLEMLLSSEGIKDFLSRQSIVESIAEHDRELLEFMKDQRDLIDAKKVELEGQRASVEVTKSRIQSRKNDLEQASREKESLISRLAEDKKKLEAEIDKQNEEAKALEKEIIKLQRVSGPYSGGRMGWPAPGFNRITSPFGYRLHPILKVNKLHTGIDIGVPLGGNIVAAADGTVIYSGYLGSYGNTIIIDHGGGITTLYAHNSSLLVGNGANVKRGDSISRAGSTGMSTGPHLHFEVRVNGAYQDPLTYLR
jgi:murein DD-endopeptidase MepM/ murein hydrolase activator NlpD